MRRFTLIINDTREGPYTAIECAVRIRSVFKGNWHWTPEQPNGSFLAVMNETDATIAEAVPEC